MTDEELEQRLGRQRLALPPASLREHVLMSATGEPVRVPLGTFDYATAAIAAGLALATVVIGVPAAPLSADSSQRVEVAELAAALGGTPEALLYAQVVISREDEPEDPVVAEAR